MGDWQSDKRETFQNAWKIILFSEFTLFKIIALLEKIIIPKLFTLISLRLSRYPPWRKRSKLRPTLCLETGNLIKGQHFTMLRKNIFISKGTPFSKLSCQNFLTLSSVRLSKYPPWRERSKLQPTLCLETGNLIKGQHFAMLRKIILFSEGRSFQNVSPVRKKNINTKICNKKNCCWNTHQRRKGADLCPPFAMGDWQSDERETFQNARENYAFWGEHPSQILSTVEKNFNPPLSHFRRVFLVETPFSKS